MALRRRWFIQISALSTFDGRIREPEKRLPHPRKAAGAQITQSRHGEVVTINTDTGLFWVLASLVPAAAVIPAPIAYIKVVAVKKLVVEPWAWLAGPPHRVYWSGRAFPSGEPHALHWACRGTRTFTLKKLETCGSILLVSRTAVMINRDSRGHQYSIVRGEILGFIED
ncbi:hypothetical protein VTO58DRAFT_108272 [Aureobasidium pullulans]